MDLITDTFIFGFSFGLGFSLSCLLFLLVSLMFQRGRR
jgi:hypothetical protein